MDSKRLPATGNTISLAEKFAFSDKFEKLFSDGMTLVEESATYLDGEGRKAAKTLPRASVVLYGTESMRLTTRLMQLASWLLLQRAANVGEMTTEQFLEEKKKVKLDTLPVSGITDDWNELPVEFTGLVSRSLTLQSRITAIDAEVYELKKSMPVEEDNPVRQQIKLLSTALGAKSRLN
jgi:regulator of CtrA degradation